MSVNLGELAPVHPEYLDELHECGVIQRLSELYRSECTNFESNFTYFLWERLGN